MRRRSLALPMAVGLIVGCAEDHSSAMEARTTAAQERAITDTIIRLVEDAYDFSKPDVVGRLMSLYPENGPIASASDGRIVTSRDSLRESIAVFWNEIGRNMQGPRWVWEERQIAVLSPSSAVMTAVYSIPHIAPSGRPHVVGGAWTAVFAKRDGQWRIVHEHLSSSPRRDAGSAAADSTRRPPP